jgi:hypothetical protein
MASNFNFGLRSLADTVFRFFQPGMPCYLRVEKSVPEKIPALSSAAQLGFQITADPTVAGFDDILIDPPPEVVEKDFKEIGLTLARLRVRDKVFTISHTFVLKEMARRRLTDMLDVWSATAVIGLFYDGRVMAIKSATHEDLAGQPVFWKVVGTAVGGPTPED